MKIHNTLSRQKENFTPIKPDKKIGMYVCGPTVYGPAHIGHARTYIVFDFIRRYLEYSDYKVTFISNITDVHDDIIKRALKETISIKELSEKFSKQFFGELEKLKIKPADKNPRVSEYIPQIIDFIKILIEKGYGYESNGSVYFDVSKFKEYGKLSRRKLEEAKSGTRVNVDKFERDEAADFALWKKTSEDEEKVEASWKSPWGKGRPGWHIECSVMSKELLGEQFDIHAGATDLIFPHHENEIAQSEAASGKSPFVKYWVHSGLLTINGQKMSKSLGNFITIEDLLKKYHPAVLRFLVLSTHYRSVLNFSEKAMEQAKAGLERFLEINRKIFLLRSIKKENTTPSENIKNLISKTEEKIKQHLNDDFDTPGAIAELFKFVKEVNLLINKENLSVKDATEIYNFLKKIDENTFNIFLDYYKDTIANKSEKLEKLLKQREIAKKEKNYSESDQIRNKINKLGFDIEDTKLGYIVKRKI